MNAAAMGAIVTLIGEITAQDTRRRAARPPEPGACEKLAGPPGDRKTRGLERGRRVVAVTASEAAFAHTVVARCRRPDDPWRRCSSKKALDRRVRDRRPGDSPGRASYPWSPLGGVWT